MPKKAKISRATIKKEVNKHPDYLAYKPGPGIIKREYYLSKTAREKWIIKEVDRIVNYLRIRSNFDGVDEFFTQQEYKSRWIRQCLKLLVKRGNGNYWGVIIHRDKYRDGMCGDSLYGEFWTAYHIKTLEEWLETPGKFRKLIKKHKAMYLERGRMHRAQETIRQLKRLPRLYQMFTAKRSMKNEGGPSDDQTDPFLHFKDHLYMARQLTAEKHFGWEKKSKKQTKRDENKKVRSKKSKTRQSLWSLMELMKHNVLIDERYNMQLMANTKDMNDRDYLYIWDHELQREHIFERLGTNPMDSDLSTWKNTMGAIDIIRHFQNKVYTSKKDMVPTLPPFMIGERWWEYKKELDLSKGGGWIDVGAHNRDSVPAQLGDEPCMVMQGEFVLTTACVTNLFGNGCNATGAKVLTLLMSFAHHMKHNHNLTGGKHNIKRNENQLSPKDREELVKQILEEEEDDDLL